MRIESANEAPLFISTELETFFKQQIAILPSKYYIYALVVFEDKISGERYAQISVYWKLKSQVNDFHDVVIGKFKEYLMYQEIFNSQVQVDSESIQSMFSKTGLVRLGI